MIQYLIKYKFFSSLKIIRAYQKLKRGNGEKQIFEIFDKIFSNFVLNAKNLA